MHAGTSGRALHFLVGGDDEDGDVGRLRRDAPGDERVGGKVTAGESHLDMGARQGVRVDSAASAHVEHDHHFSPTQGGEARETLHQPVAPLFEVAGADGVEGDVEYVVAVDDVQQPLHD